MYKENAANYIKFTDELTEKYGFQGLIHVTDFENFKKVFKSGYLRSRNQLLRENLLFTDSASSEVLSSASRSVKDSVRFYYRPKTPTFYRNEGIKEGNSAPHMPIPVCLVFSKELILLSNTYFTDGNATNYNTIKGSDFKFFRNIDWDKVFHTGSISYEQRDEFVRKRHAELLSNEAVSLEYLKKIVFRCEADLRRAKHLFGDNKLFIVDSNMFYNMNNYVKQCNIVKNDNELILEASFNKRNYKEFKHKVKILNEDDFELYNYDLDFSKVNGVSWIYKMKDYNSEWTRLEYYMDDNLCIEEYLNQNRNLINNFELFVDTKRRTLILSIAFRDIGFLKNKHSFEMLDEYENPIVKSQNILYKDDNRLDRSITFSNYDNNWEYFRYSIDGCQCICKRII